MCTKRRPGQQSFQVKNSGFKSTATTTKSNNMFTKQVNVLFGAWGAHVCARNYIYIGSFDFTIVT